MEKKMISTEWYKVKDILNERRDFVKFDFNDALQNAAYQRYGLIYRNDNENVIVSSSFQFDWKWNDKTRTREYNDNVVYWNKGTRYYIKTDNFCNNYSVRIGKKAEKYNKWIDKIKVGDFVRFSGQRDSRSWRKIVRIFDFDIAGTKYQKSVDNEKYCEYITTTNGIETIIEHKEMS